MSIPARAELIKWSAALKPDEPLDVGDPDDRARYVPLEDAGRGAVDDMQDAIELSMETTTQLLTGPTGSGKTTELLRLRHNLGERGYHATYVNLLDYISNSAPIDVTEFLIALALGSHDATVGADGRTAAGKPSFLARLGDMLSRLHIDLDIGGSTAKISGDGIELGVLGATVGLDLAKEIKEGAGFVDELRRKLSYHLTQLYDEVATFLVELLPDEQTNGSVLIIDGLEKIRGNTTRELEVQQSIETLFVNHSGKLRFASHHVVYTVPTYLQFTSPGALPYTSRQFVPVPHVTPRPGHDDPEAAASNVRELREVVSRRVPVEHIVGDVAALDPVIEASGGHLRDLFAILQRLLRLALRLGLEQPVEPRYVAEAITLVVREFGQMTEEQAAFLREVDGAKGAIRPDPDQVQLMALLLQGHMLLAHLNDEYWYEVHPLARRALGLP